MAVRPMSLVILQWYQHRSSPRGLDRTTKTDRLRVHDQKWQRRLLHLPVNREQPLPQGLQGANQIIDAILQHTDQHTSPAWRCEEIYGMLRHHTRYTVELHEVKGGVILIK